MEIVDAGSVRGKALAAGVETLRRLLDDLVHGAASHVATVLVTQPQSDKLRYLEAHMTDRCDERREKHAKPTEERLQARIERVARKFKRLTGGLDDGQIAMIRIYSAKAVADNALWLSEREKLQHAFLALLVGQLDKAQISAFVYKILMRENEVSDPSYEVVWEKRWQRFQGLLTDIMMRNSAPR